MTKTSTGLERSVAAAFKVFASQDAMLFEEHYNLLNAFLAALPANYRYNLRFNYILNSNYADFSFLFTPQNGRAVERASRCRISGGFGNQPKHALLSESPLPRHPAHAHAGDDGNRQILHL